MGQAGNFQGSEVTKVVEMIILAGFIFCLALVAAVVEDPRQRVQRFFCWVVFLILWGLRGFSCIKKKKGSLNLVNKQDAKLREPKRRGLVMGNEENSAA